MALGKPVVAFDLAETRFSAQDAALYATPNLVEDFASKIEILLENEELRLEMGEFGRRRIEETLNWDCDRQFLLLAHKALFPERFESLVLGSKEDLVKIDARIEKVTSNAR